MLSLSKLVDIPIRLHRAIPDDAKLKQVTIKKEPTGERFATFGVEMDREPPKPPENPERCVGIDVGILEYAHDTDGTAVGSPDFSAEWERLEREQRSLSRKEHGSNNYEKQRRRVAECHADLRRKRRDFIHLFEAKAHGSRGMKPTRWGDSLPSKGRTGVLTLIINFGPLILDCDGVPRSWHGVFDPYGRFASTTRRLRKPDPVHGVTREVT